MTPIDQVFNYFRIKVSKASNFRTHDFQKRVPSAKLLYQVEEWKCSDEEEEEALKVLSKLELIIKHVNGIPKWIYSAKDGRHYRYINAREFIPALNEPRYNTETETLVIKPIEERKKINETLNSKMRELREKDDVTIKLVIPARFFEMLGKYLNPSPKPPQPVAES